MCFCRLIHCFMKSVISTRTRFITVVDTISATVIFYFLLLCRQFLRENRDFQNISAVEQTVKSHLPQPGVPKSTACENCNRYKNTNDKLLFFIYTEPSMAGSNLGYGRFSFVAPGHRGQKGQNRTDPEQQNLFLPSRACFSLFS